MSIIGTDSRQVINTFDVFPFSAVTRVDDNNPNTQGTGITVGVNHVLTAAHAAFDDSTNTVITPLRTTISADSDSLVSRIVGNPNDPGGNIANINFLAGYDNTEAAQDDIALLTITDAPLDADDAIGLLAFLDPQSAVGLTIDTAGYPFDNVTSNIPDNSGNPVRDLVRSPGAFNSPGQIEFMARGDAVL